ncbi:hypothetical protein GCM10028778_03530 [Barrientosiimonas marina]|uniref:Flagellar biosynthetic protein FliO n=1 Tax=Lentibacillus kimchii TaxID=1542911 RepID=A0ABW2UR28_9BACI
MKLRIMAGLCLIGLWFIAVPTDVVLAESNVKDCIENDDCEQTDPAETEQENKADEPETGSLAINLVKMVLALVLVLALIYFLLKILQKRSKRFQNFKGLENIGGASVGANKSVQLLRIGSRVFMVGVGDNVQLLQELSEDDVKQDQASNDHADNHHTTNRLPALFQSRNTQKNNGDQTNHFRDLFATELDKLKKTRHSLMNQPKQKDDNDE